MSKNNELTTEVKAKETHENASIYYSRAEFNLYKHVMEVKKIRDERYYRELGYETFDDYCQKEWGVKRDIMYQRIQTAERLSEEDFVAFNLQFGHTKSLLLSRMTEPQREQALDKGIPVKEGYKPYKEATQKEINDYRRNAEGVEQETVKLKNIKSENDNGATIYIMKHKGFNNYYKIGKTEDVEIRKNTLNTASPLGVEVVYSVETSSINQVEKIIHHKYSDRQSNREWFNFSEGEISEVIKYIEKLINNV